MLRQRAVWLACFVVASLFILLVTPVSVAAEKPVRMTFSNNTDGDTELFWRDSGKGKEASYGVVPKGKSKTQDTYHGHVWVARSARGDELERYTVNSPEGAAVAFVLQGPQANLLRKDTRGPQANLPRKDTRPKDAPTSYWLGRKKGPAKNEYVFDIRVPDDLAALLNCSQPRYAKFLPGVKQFSWEARGQTWTFTQNAIGWDHTLIDGGQLTYDRGGALGELWATLATTSEDWKACKEQLKAQAKVHSGTWKTVAPILVRVEGTASPDLTVNFDADRPYNVRKDPPSRQPQIVPVVVNDNVLHLAYQTWGANGPTGKIVVCQAGGDELKQGKLAAVREVGSLGSLLGFAVDPAAGDFVFTAKAEDFANNPEGDFVNTISRQWRPNVARLYSKGQARDLNSDKFTELTFYGLMNSGSGRLAVGANHLAAVFSRREYTASDNLIHQHGVDLLMDQDLTKVPVKAGNSASHSFDQRLVFDGRDFVVLHQCDTYPFRGLIIQKLRTRPGGNNNSKSASYAAYACPTFGNSTYFELGGLVADKNEYPVLFTSTRNTRSVDSGSQQAMNNVAWDLALACVARDFDTRPAPANPYDILSSNILARGYGHDEDFTVKNFTWNPATSRYDAEETCRITRRVHWLTNNNATTKAANAKLARLRDRGYIAIWEEHTLNNGGWQYATTRATFISYNGVTFAASGTRELKGMRLNQGDDAVTLWIDRNPHAVWVTAGDSNHKLQVNTLSESLDLKTYQLQLP